MELKRLHKAFGWLRTVQINQSLLTDYSSEATYLKGSEKEKVITEFETYIIGLMAESTRASDLIGVQATQLVKLQDRIAELELAQERLLRNNN